MALVTLNGLKAKDIPYEAQIIRVADEFEAISSKRQYKTHVGIVETLNIMIENTKPNPLKLSDGLKILSQETRVGKIDRKIVKALFKVVIDDTEYEIYVREKHLKYLKQEIKRLEEANKYFRKMEAAITNSKKEYYREYTVSYLKKNEKLELVPQILDDLKNTYNSKAEHVEKLYSEIRQIKRLVV